MLFQHRPVLRCCPLAACNGFHAIPDLPRVIMLQLLFYLPSVILPCLSQVDLEFPLYALQLVSVTIPECPLLLVQDVLDITGDLGLVVGKQRTVLMGTTTSIQNFRQSVVQCVTPLMSSPCSSCRTLQSVHSKQSLRASAASGDHFLKGRLVMDCLWICGLYCGVSRTRLWSDFPSGGKGVAV